MGRALDKFAADANGSHILKNGKFVMPDTSVKKLSNLEGGSTKAANVVTAAAGGGGIGHLIGKGIDRLTGNKEGRGAKIGAGIGAALGAAGGALIPFKKGGRVHKTGAAIVHKGEFILPVGVAPTKSQIIKVRGKKGLGLRKKRK